MKYEPDQDCPDCAGTGLDPKGKMARSTSGGEDEFPPCVTCGGSGLGPLTESQWEAFAEGAGFDPYPDAPKVVKSYLDMTQENLAALVEGRDVELAVVRERMAMMKEILLSLRLYIGHFEWKQLTTPQKNFFADMIDTDHRENYPDDYQPMERWWQ